MASHLILTANWCHLLLRKHTAVRLYLIDPSSAFIGVETFSHTYAFAIFTFFSLG